MKAFSSTTREMNLGCSVKMCSSYLTVLKNFLDKKCKICTVKQNTTMMFPQVLGHPENAPWVYRRVHMFKTYSFVSCFPTIRLYKTKLKYRTMKLKTYEKYMWMVELGAIYHLALKGSFLMHPESALWVYHRLHFMWWDYWRNAFKQFL